MFVSGCDAGSNTSEYLLLNVSGDSMEPTLMSGQEISVVLGVQNLDRGDVVLIKLKTVSKPYVKRVIALPGDEVRFGGNSIFLNGGVLEEPYLLSHNGNVSFEGSVLEKQLEFYNNKVPSENILVLGDNRAASFDSGSFGLVPVRYVLGKVVVG